jgi:hypothetical protein
MSENSALNGSGVHRERVGTLFDELAKRDGKLLVRPIERINSGGVLAVVHVLNVDGNALMRNVGHDRRGLYALRASFVHMQIPPNNLQGDDKNIAYCLPANLQGDNKKSLMSPCKSCQGYCSPETILLFERGNRVSCAKPLAHVRDRLLVRQGRIESPSRETVFCLEPDERSRELDCERLRSSRIGYSAID